MNRIKISLIVLMGLLSLQLLYAQPSPLAPPQPLFTPPQQIQTMPPETQERELEIKIENNSVYLKASNVSLKEILKALAEKTNFELILNSSTTILSTSIEGLPVDETIQRLMNIVQEKNYNIYYDEKGMIKRLEVFPSTETGASQQPQRPPLPKIRRQPPQGHNLNPPQGEVQPPAQVIPQDEE